MLQKIGSSPRYKNSRQSNYAFGSSSPHSPGGLAKPLNLDLEAYIVRDNSSKIASRTEITSPKNINSLNNSMESTKDLLQKYSNPTENNQYGFINEIQNLNQSVASIDSIQKEQQIIIDLTPTQLEIIKAINLADFELLLKLGVTGLELGGLTDFGDPDLSKDGTHILEMSKDGTHIITREYSSESLKIHPNLIKKQIDTHLEARMNGKQLIKSRQNPINLNFKITEDGITPLMLACTSGNIDIVKLILVNPTLVLDKQDNSGINSLYVCAYYGHFEIFKLLRQLGAKYQTSEKGSTILHVVSKKGFNDILKYLLHEHMDERIPIDSVKNNGMTAAMLAVQKNHLFILRMLKESGANLNITLEGGVNLLYLAAEKGHHVIVSYLLDKLINPDANMLFDKNEQTAIQIATKNGHFDVVSVLIDKCPQIMIDITKQRTKNQDNLLYLAIKSKSKKLVKMFAHFFVQENCIDDENPVSGLTSFMLAALSNLQSIALFLSEQCGANKDYKNRYNETSLHIAKRKQLNKAVLFLQKIGCRQDIENNDGITLNQIVVHEKQLRDKQLATPATASPKPSYSPTPVVGSKQAKSPMFRIKNNSPAKQERQFKLNLQSVKPPDLKSEKQVQLQLNSPLLQDRLRNQVIQQANFLQENQEASMMKRYRVSLPNGREETVVSSQQSPTSRMIQKYPNQHPQEEVDNTMTHDLDDVPCDQIVPNHNLRFKPKQNIQLKAIINTKQKLPQITPVIQKQGGHTDSSLIQNINANHVQMKIMPNEIIRIQAQLRDLRNGNISSIGPMISPKSILTINQQFEDQSPHLSIGSPSNRRLVFHSSVKSPKSDVHNFINNQKRLNQQKRYNLSTIRSLHDATSPIPPEYIQEYSAEVVNLSSPMLSINKYQL